MNSKANETIVRFTAMQVPFYFEEDGDGFSGHLTTALNLYKAKFPFKCQVDVKPYINYGKVENGNGTGLIGDLMRNEADMAILPLTPTLENIQYLDFTSPVQTREWKIIAAAPKEYTSHLFDVLRTFLPEVWISILISGFLFAIIWTSLHRFLKHKGGTPRRFGRKSTHFSKIVFREIGVLLGQCVTITPNPAERMVWATWILASLGLSVSFMNDILSNLTVPDNIKILETFKDILDYPDVQFYVFKDTPAAYIIERSQNPIVQEVWKDIVFRNSFIIYGETDIFDVFARANEGSLSVLLAPEIISEAVYTFEMCDGGKNLRIPKNPIVINSYSFAMRKGLPRNIAVSFKKLAMAVFESGILDQSIEFGSFMGRKCFASSNEDDYFFFKPLGSKSVLAPLCIIGFGVILTSAVLFLEIIQSKRLRARKKIVARRPALFRRQLNDSLIGVQRQLKITSSRPNPVKRAGDIYHVLKGKVFKLEIVYDFRDA